MVIVISLNEAVMLTVELMSLYMFKVVGRKADVQVSCQQAASCSLCMHVVRWGAAE